MSGQRQLVNMANDIGAYFRAEPQREDAIAGIVGHIKRFWTPRMRQKLVEHLRHGGEGLEELPREAIGRLEVSQPWNSGAS